MKQQKEELEKKGLQVFADVDEKTKDTLFMARYFIAFLKSGSNRSKD